MIVRVRLGEARSSPKEKVVRRMLQNAQPNAQSKGSLPAKFHPSYSPKNPYPKREVRDTIKGRKEIALQVRNSRSPQWGTLSGRGPINEGTSYQLKEEYKEHLSKIMTKWLINGYFGPDASFRIKEVIIPDQVRVYFA